MQAASADRQESKHIVHSSDDTQSSLHIIFILALNQLNSMGEKLSEKEKADSLCVSEAA